MRIWYKCKSDKPMDAKVVQFRVFGKRGLLIPVFVGIQFKDAFRDFYKYAALCLSLSFKTFNATEIRHHISALESFNILPNFHNICGFDYGINIGKNMDNSKIFNHFRDLKGRIILPNI